MKRTFLLLFLGVVLSLGSAQTQPEEAEGEEEAVDLFTTPTTKMGAAISDFGYNLFRQMASHDTTTNIFMSPVSLSVALTQLSLGASERAEKQLHRALRYHTLQNIQLQETLRELLASLKASGKGFSSAARVLLARRLRPQAGYLNDVEKHYGIKPLTLMGGARDMKTVNDWFKRETDGKISQVISTPLPRNGGITSVGAASLKGKWLTRFSQTNQMENFHTDGEAPVQVPMMRQTNYPFKMGTDTDIGCTIAQIQMEGGLSMFFFLPDEVTQNLTQIVESLTAEFVQDLSMNLHPAKAELILPVLKLSYATDLLPVLPDLGLSEWLAETDLIKITPQPAKLAAVYHKVMMEMAPEGSQYASTTAGQHLTYRVDRPFLFLVRDEPTGTLLFIGKVLNPQGTKA